jgi:hypothetical protein
MALAARRRCLGKSPPRGAFDQVGPSRFCVGRTIYHASALSERGSFLGSGVSESGHKVDYQINQ